MENEDVPILIQYATVGDYIPVRDLLQEGVDVNCTNHLGQTALHKAAAGGHVDVVSILIAAGKNIDVTDKKGQTPLYTAIHHQQYDTARLLLENGANPNGSNTNNSLPIQICIMHKDMKTTQLLLEYGADINNIKLRLGLKTKIVGGLIISRSLDHHVCFEMLKLFLLYGANPNSGIKYRGTTTDTSPYYEILTRHRPLSMFVLLYEFGCNLWNFEWKSKTLYVNEAQQLDENLMKTISTLAEVPRRLNSHCRLLIHHYFGRTLQYNVERLPLPPFLQTYLLFNDIQCFV